ncbi:MAG: hypothetical protein IJ282_10250 [Lachnospiraceae bacterium]|nr:hypothetical protein [Lachnospiraceae bacterium]
MTGLIFSSLTLFISVYHILIGFFIKKGKIREGYCALWVGDSLFSLFGMIITFSVYRYSFFSLISFRNILLTFTVLIIALLIILLSPSGLGLFRVYDPLTEDEIIRAEYRFNDTAGLIRNLFFLMLFLLPLFFALPTHLPEYFSFLSYFKEGELCSGFCLIAFLLLLPLSFRQTLFWLRDLTHSPSQAELELVKSARAKIYYKRRNFSM